MSDSPREVHETRLAQLIEEASHFDLHDDKTTTALRNLKTFSELKLPPVPEPEPTPEPEPIPATGWAKVKENVAAVWESETTRAVIKAGGAFAGVALVAWTTIHRDHVMERQALAQANQRPS